MNSWDVFDLRNTDRQAGSQEELEGVQLLHNGAVKSFRTPGDSMHFPGRSPFDLLFHGVPPAQAPAGTGTLEQTQELLRVVFVRLGL